MPIHCGLDLFILGGSREAHETPGWDLPHIQDNIDDFQVVQGLSLQPHMAALPFYPNS